jgi:hypothetical protein
MVTPPVTVLSTVSRRGWLAVLAGLAGCATEGPSATALPGQPLLWRTLQGGTLANATPAVGLPVAPGSGAFVRFTSPSAIAIRGTDLLVADLAHRRLWRTELTSGSLTAIPDAPVAPNMALALGPDLSAWVLDVPALQVLRYARDGRLLQSLRLPMATPTPVAMVLADGGATLLVADGMSAQWVEQRGNVPRFIQPMVGDRAPISGADGLAVPPSGHLQVLDRLAGQVHECTREGQCIKSRGKGELLQPVALVLDRHGRPIVHDAQDNSLKRLADEGPAERWSAAQLGVQRISGIALDGSFLAVSDALGGRVVVHSLLHEAAR